MPKNASQPIDTRWSQITANDISDITFQNTGGRPVVIQGTNGTTAPTADAGLVYQPGEGEASRALSEMFPGITGVNRVWARVDNLTTVVFTSHA
jgi:hypothetical protein